MKNDDSNKDSLWQGIFDGNVTVLMLGIGLFFVFCNVVIFAGIDIRPSAWLYLLDIRYWSIYFAMLLWIAVIWVAAESTDIVEDYLPSIRIAMVICSVLIIIFAVRSFFSTPSTGTANYSILLNFAIIISIACIVRSLFLLYDYRSNGDKYIDMEEATWFWGMSAFFIIGSLICAIMSVIPVTTQLHSGMDAFVTESLLMSCIIGLQEVIRSGQGSFALKMFGLLMFIVSIAFVYVVGKWALIFLSKIRPE